MYRNVLYLVWFYNEIQAENKTSEILRVQKKKKSKRKDNALILFWRQTCDRKRDSPTGNYYLVLLKKQRWKETELKMLEGDSS